MAASLLFDWNAENGVVGQKPPAPLSAVTGPNVPIITNSPVYAGTKAYDVLLDRSQPTILGQVQNPYRTQMKGGVGFEFERIYWIGFSFRRTVWDYDTSAEAWPMDAHEVPYSDWSLWTNPDCVNSALNVSPFLFYNVNGVLSFRNLANTLWTKPIDVGIWHTIVLQIKLSKGTTGFIRSWYDGVEQPRHPTTGTTQTHRADNALPPACAKPGEPTFGPPALQIGIYKWDWKTGRPATLTTIRRGTIDSIRIAQDIAGTDDAGGFALVNPGSVPDTTPPTISNLTNTSINANTRRISWLTNENSTSVVEFGLTTAYSSTPVSNTSLVTSHTLDLTNLAAGTTYYYRVKSTDSSGNIATSTGQNFTTAPLTDTITNIVVTTTATGATITWTTGEPRSSIIDYGLTTGYGLNLTTSSLVTNHSKVLTGLAPGTVYNYKLSGLNASSASIATTNLTFTTLSSVYNVHITVVTTDSFRADWNSTNTVIPSLRYGLTSSYGNILTKAVPANTAHSIRITNLSPGTQYHYQVGSLDDNIWSSDQVITLTSLTEAITNIVKVYNSPTSVTITWNTTGSLDSKVSYGLSPNLLDSEVLDSNLVTSHSITLTGLTSNKTYYFKLRSAAPYGAIIESITTTFITRTISGGRSDSFD